MTFVVTARVGKNLPSNVGFRDMHRLACFLLEDAGDEAHNQQSKPFAVRPLRVFEHDDRMVEIELHSFNDDPLLHERIMQRLSGYRGSTPNLKRDVPLIDPRVEVSVETWDEMFDVSGARSADVDLESPLSYSRQGAHYPLPDPVLVHRQLAHRWNEHAPDDRMRISDEHVRLVIDDVTLTHVRIESTRLSEYHGRLAGIGSFSFELSTASEVVAREWFTSLWHFARFTGLGALTAHGLGAVDVALR